VSKLLDKMRFTIYFVAKVINNKVRNK